MSKKKKNIDKLIDKYEKRYFAQKGANIEVKPKIRTGIFSLDYVLDGGISQDLGGHMIEFYGGESSGKSTVSLKIISQYQKLGKDCVYIDAENSYDPVYADILGVDNENILVLKPSTLEDAGDVLLELMGEVDLIVIDSITALVPNSEVGRDLENKTMGAQASVNSVLCRKLNRVRNKTATSIIFINQLREKVGQMFGSPLTTSGGRCFDTETRVVTKDGYKGLDGIRVGDLVPTLNLKTGKVEYKPIVDVFEYDYNGQMIRFINKHRNIKFLFTPNHKCLVKKYHNGKTKYPHYKIIEAKKQRKTYPFPVCFSSKNEDLDISSEKLIKEGPSLPDWIFKLSDNQVKTLIESLKHKPTLIKNKNKEWIKKLHLLMATHNIASYKHYESNGEYNIRLKTNDYIHFKSGFENYKGKVWDIQVQDNPLHFIERNGCIIATHNSLKHLYDTRVYFKQGKPIDVGSGDNKERIGFHMDMWCKKNKKGKPYKRMVVKYYFNGHLEEKMNLLIAAIRFGVIEKGGSWYEYGDIKIQGKENLFDEIKDWDKLQKKVLKAMGKKHIKKEKGD